LLCGHYQLSSLPQNTIKIVYYERQAEING
jgi:hypothetical protein